MMLRSAAYRVCRIPCMPLVGHGKTSLRSGRAPSTRSCDYTYRLMAVSALHRTTPSVEHTHTRIISVSTMMTAFSLESKERPDHLTGQYTFRFLPICYRAQIGSFQKLHTPTWLASTLLTLRAIKSVFPCQRSNCVCVFINKWSVEPCVSN